MPPHAPRLRPIVKFIAKIIYFGCYQTRFLTSFRLCSKFQTYNDGKWHTVELAMSKNYAVLSIDNEKAETKRILDISTGPYYMIGGGIYGQKGFIG